MKVSGNKGKRQAYAERERAAFRERQLVKPDRYRWKKSYTFVLLANAGYILLFYFLMNFFT